MSQFPPENTVGLTVDLMGISTDSNCSYALSAIMPLHDGNVTLTAVADDFCQATVIFNASLPDIQRGIVPVRAELCGLDVNTPIEYLPVLFWIYAGETAPRNDSVLSLICRPYIEPAATTTYWGREQAYDDILAAYGTMGLELLSVDQSYDVEDLPANNVTGSPLNGRAYNGYVQVSFMCCVASSSFTSC